MCMYIYVCVYIKNMVYYSAIKNDEMLPFATMWRELGSIMLSLMSQRKTNTIWFHSYIEFKKQTDEHRGREGKIR